MQRPLTNSHVHFIICSHMNMATLEQVYIKTFQYASNLEPSLPGSRLPARMLGCSAKNERYSNSAAHSDREWKLSAKVRLRRGPLLCAGDGGGREAHVWVCGLASRPSGSARGLEPGIPFRTPTARQRPV